MANELKALGDRHGVDFRILGGEVGTAGGVIKVGVTLKALPAGVKTRANIDWDNYCQMFGLKSSDFGRTFVTNRGLYKITGINPRAPKYPIQGEELHSKRQFKFPAYSVTAGLAKQAA